MNVIKELYTIPFSKAVIDNVLSSVASGLLLSLLAAALHLRLPDLPVLLFWKRFSQGLTLITSEVNIPFDPQMRTESPPSLLLRGEGAALGELLHFFRHRCKTAPPTVSVNNTGDFDSVKDKNLLILGGPKYNNAARTFLQEISDELFYQPKRLLQDGKVKANDPELKVFVGKDTRYPDFTYNVEDEIQYTTIIFRKDLYVSGKWVLLIAGLSDDASLAGVTWLLTRPCSFWLHLRKQPKGFQAMIKCRIIDRAKVSKVEAVFYHDLS